MGVSRNSAILTDLEVMFTLMEAPIEIADMPNARPLKLDSGHIQSNEVHFHYGSGRPILKGISFEVPAGKTVAIVGPSEQENNDFAPLYRFYDLKKGTITIDGQDISMVQQIVCALLLAWCHKIRCCLMIRLSIISAMGR